MRVAAAVRLAETPAGLPQLLACLVSTEFGCAVSPGGWELGCERAWRLAAAGRHAPCSHVAHHAIGSSTCQESIPHSGLHCSTGLGRWNSF